LKLVLVKLLQTVKLAFGSISVDSGHQHD
jgi:hypothetical protein